MKPFKIAFLGCLSSAVIAGCGDDTDGSGTTSSSSSGGATSSASTGSSDGGNTSSSSAGGSGGSGGAAPVVLTSKTTDTRFHTAEHMMAAVEMQISGEPFAELIGRDLGGYDRFGSQTDLYLDPDTKMPVVDPLGWSLAIESYEYSKQPMNNLSFESGAGISLMYGPNLNPTGQTGDAGFNLLLNRLQTFAIESRASGAKVGKDFVNSPAPTNDPTNYYGWPGFWPSYLEYADFDPAIVPSVGADHQCSLAGATDEPAPPNSSVQYVGDYECDYNSLHLKDRETQVSKVIQPDALGNAAWKQGLWAINYWSSFHDVDQDPIIQVSNDSLSKVGQKDNTVIGQWPDPTDPSGQSLVFGKAGTYLGDVSLEGWQGLVMLDEIDNKSKVLLSGLVTKDGTTLAGFASIKSAIDYSYTSNLAWWPAAIKVTESVTAPDSATATKYFPKPTAMAISDGTSRLQDITALLGGFAQAFAMADKNNPDVGGSPEFLATFDGDPFAADNQVADGEDTLHDRALGVLKVGLVNLDRLHFDAKHKVLVDSSTISGQTVTLGTTVSTYHTGYSIVAIRSAFRGISGSLELYTNDTPDVLHHTTALDSTALDGSTFSGTFGDHVIELITDQGDFLADKILDSTGHACNGYDLATDTRDPSPTTLDSQTAAIRGLLDAYLATSDQKYRDAATLAYNVLQTDFWMDDARIYRTTAGESTTMTYSPRVFGALVGAQRQFEKLVASQPGNEVELKALLDQIVRTNKLILNGWDDRNQNDTIDAGECLGGRLQMAERALTGEFSIAADSGDRDHDCVPDIATAKLPSALAHELVITRN